MKDGTPYRAKDAAVSKRRVRPGGSREFHCHLPAPPPVPAIEEAVFTNSEGRWRYRKVS